jgi:hypothetical protein
MLAKGLYSMSALFLFEHSTVDGPPDLFGTQGGEQVKVAVGTLSLKTH